MYWSHGGRTSLGNLISLCKAHHTLVHERGYLIAAPPGGGFAFYRPDGTALPASPALPPPDGTIGDCHDAGITPETIIPPWYGERLNLDDAIYVCLANARTPGEKQQQRDQADDPGIIPAPQMGRRTSRLDPVPPGTHRRLTAGPIGPPPSGVRPAWLRAAAERCYAMPATCILRRLSPGGVGRVAGCGVRSGRGRSGRRRR